MFRLHHTVRNLAILIAVSIAPFSVAGQSHHWNSHAEVAKKVKETFHDIDTYTANFVITTEEANIHRTMRGILYYKKGGKIRFDFTSPAGDFMVTDGKILWIYIRKLNAVGKQDLTLDLRDENNSKIFLATPGPGLERLFKKYHYRFDGVEQPRTVDGKSYFVLDMNQMVKIGGFERITLFIDSDTFLIAKAIGTDNLGKKTTVTFSNQTINPPLEGKLFQYSPDDRVRVVNNPLVTD